MNRETVQFINNLSAAVTIQSPLPHSHDQGGPTHSHDHGGEHGHTHEHLEHPGKQRVLLLEPKRMSQHWEQANMQNAISPTTGLGIGRKEGLLLASGGEYPLQCPLADTYSYLIFQTIDQLVRVKRPWRWSCVKHYERSTTLVSLHPLYHFVPIF